MFLFSYIYRVKLKSVLQSSGRQRNYKQNRIMNRTKKKEAKYRDGKPWTHDGGMFTVVR